MGALVIDRVLLRGPKSGDERVVRVAGGLALHLGHDPQLLPLLGHLFAGGAAPELSAAAVEFVLNGAAFQWRSDFSLGQCELLNRSNNRRLTDPGAIAGYLDREMGREHNRRTAAFKMPPPEVQPRETRPAAVSDVPPCDQLAEELAKYEAALRRASQAQTTATALYADLFPLLESLEQASEKLEARVRQLERHREAEEVHARYVAVEKRVQEQIEAKRKAHQLEKNLAELSKHEEEQKRIPAEVIEKAEHLTELVEQARVEYNTAENSRREAQAEAGAVDPKPWWTGVVFGVGIIAAGILARPLLPYTLYGSAAGVVLMILSLVMALTKTSHRNKLRNALQVCKDLAKNAKGDLQLAELAVTQYLKPYRAAHITELKRKAHEIDEWHTHYEALRTELAELRRRSGTDDDLQRRASQESAELAELQERCRALGHHRLSESDRQQIEKMIHDLEVEARYQEKTTSVLKKQCEELSVGWSDLAANLERVEELRTQLAEWQRWDKAFQRIREVVDCLPHIGDDPEQNADELAAEYLRRITGGRWTELRYDPAGAEFSLYDSQAGIWIRADRENPAVHSTVGLAYRLSVLDSGTVPIRLPIWLEEPFAELPEAMANATAALLAEVAHRRQVVLVCRQRPNVNWPAGVLLQN